MQTLATSREEARESICQAQRRYKAHFDKGASQRPFRIGDWVLVKFPQEEQGKERKFSQPWHGPYRVLSRNDPDLTIAKVYYPQEGAIQIYQEPVCFCPVEFPPGFFWYGKRRHAVGRPHK